MADILPFENVQKKTRKHSESTVRAKKQGKGNTLCRQGHHKWIVVTDSRFDVKQGKLVTVLQCSRCGKRKVRAL